MNIKSYVKELVSDFRAWRRDEHRVAPRGTRGRVYVKNDAPPADPVFRVKKEPTATLTMRITRVDGSKETITVPAQVIQNG